MAAQDKGLPLPKFGEWDVNNPASAEGFTVIFNKARDERKTGVDTGAQGRNDANGYHQQGGYQHEGNHEYPQKSRNWFCCG